MEVTIEQWAASLYQRADRLNAITREACRAAAERVADLLRDNAPVGATQGLRDSIVVTETTEGAVVEVRAPYAAAVEYGSRPHWAPIGPLLAWAEWIAPKIGIPSEEVSNFAHAVQAKIAREGTKPTWWVTSLIPEMQAILAEEMAARLGG